MDKVNYIAVESNDGELLVYVDDETVINKTGYNIILGYGEPIFEDVDGEVRLVHDDAIEAMSEEQTNED